MNIPGFGEKFLGVEAGGVLNLYGKDKRSWTKLTKHANKFDKALGEIFNHKVCFLLLILLNTSSS